MKKNYYECECYGEGIMITYDYFIDEPPELSLCFFQYGWMPKTELSFRQKCRWIWQIMTKGLPWTDMVMLNQDTAKALGEDLITFGNKDFKKARKQKDVG